MLMIQNNRKFTILAFNCLGRDVGSLSFCSVSSVRVFAICQWKHHASVMWPRNRDGLQQN